MTAADEARSVAESVFASLAPREARLVWDDAETLHVLFAGSVEGMSIDLSDSPATIGMKVADRLQTIFIEATQTVVPDCPHHPGSHPLTCRVVDGTAVWLCPVSGEVIRSA